MTTIRITVLAVGLGIAGLVLPGPALAVWRVVGPGMAVGEARSGEAAVAAECLHDGLVLGIFNIDWEFDHAEQLDLVVDGEVFVLRQYGHGDRIVLSDYDSPAGNLDISPRLRAALKAGSEARLEGPAVAHIDPRTITFGMAGSDAAISTVERYCE